MGHYFARRFYRHERVITSILQATVNEASPAYALTHTVG